jgi:toxin ParE1/3/4
MIRLKWSAAAREDMNIIREYLLQNAPSALIVMHDRIAAAAKSLQQFPRCGRIGRVEGTRELIVTNAPYMLVYTVEDTHVAIAHVMHQAQLWPPGTPQEE